MVNRERKKKVRVDEGIKKEEWKGYFKKLLRGVGEKVVKSVRYGNVGKIEE